MPLTVGEFKGGDEVLEAKAIGKGLNGGGATAGMAVVSRNGEEGFTSGHM